MNEGKNIILDVDGVIFDSNGLKEKNIFAAAKEYCNESTAQEFAAYFTSHNGVPRKIKIDTYFAGDPYLTKNILEKYNAHNEHNLRDVAFTSFAAETITQLHTGWNLYALSGGETEELAALFEYKRISSYFSGILGGPKTKSENLSVFPQQHFAWYVGDSRVDHETSLKYDIPFVFMHGYSQFREWEEYFMAFPSVKIIRDLQNLNAIIT